MTNFKKRFSYSLILCGSLLWALSGCGDSDKANSGDYMLQNISSWNGAAKEFNDWTAGGKSQKFFPSIERRHGMDAIISHLSNARDALIKNRAGMEAYAFPSDAADLNAKLVDTQAVFIDIFDVMLKMDALPDGFSDAQIDPLISEYKRLHALALEKYDILEKAQKDYAKSHGIALSRYQPK